MDNVAKNTQIKSPSQAKNKFYRTLTNFIFLIAIIIIVVISLLSVVQFYNLLRANRLVTHTYQVLLTTDEVLYQITYMESRQRGFLLFNEKMFIHDLDENTLKIQKTADILLEITKANPSQHARVVKLTDLINQRIKRLNGLIKIKLANKLAQKGNFDWL